MSRENFSKKLGDDVLRRFRVYNHNPYEHHVHLEMTSRGTSIKVHREVMDCGLKIGIGGLIPRPGAGFCGGAKLVFRGVRNEYRVRGLQPRQDTDSGRRVRDDRHARQGRRKPHARGRRGAVWNVWLDLKIDLLINNRCEVVGVFAGDFIAQHRTGVEQARKLYATSCPKDVDIVVSNTYPNENQATKGVWPARVSLKQGGIAVIVTQR